MSTEKCKSALRQLLEEGPHEPLLLEKLRLLEQLQDAHAQNDTKKMLEIGQSLSANAKDINAKRAELRNAMSKAIEEARQTSDPEERTRAFLNAFELCAKTQVIANDHFGDIETQNIATQQKITAVEELDAIPPGRRSALALFLEHPDPGVRVSAAAYLYFRGLMTEQVVPILKDAEAHLVGAASSTAFQALHLPRMSGKP
jgi:hypothetical protein